MVRGADSHPAIRQLRDSARVRIAKTYPLSDAGQGIADGIEGRRRWVVVPGWGRALLVLRTALAPLFDREGYAWAAEADELFEADVRERGAKAASAPVGPGGHAAAGGADGGSEGVPEGEPETAATS
jgi:hypothetical protein